MAEEFELQKTLVVDFTSASGRRYQGTVIFKRPTILERSRIGVLKAQYSQGMGNVDAYTDLLHTAMATLDVVCIQKPQWLNYETLYDDDVIFHIFVEYKKWEAFFRPTPAEEQRGGNTDGNKPRKREAKVPGDTTPEVVL